ncbi:prepilin-type N-terminal cleavage/methylation domain-containing protein [Poriferisphaera sp. WC338]|uniref:prepilin-type N-terminal cleavage/methylation domain-containing protein n=1 Tax=Poriferisphaera sp. WC338 TaxID=3425129 RepID=UPI003D814C52
MKRKQAFTLIELLVVISIIALLISILLPALSKARSAGIKIQCLSNLRQLGIATYTYLNDYDEFLPSKSIKLPTNAITASAFYWVGKRGDSTIARYHRAVPSVRHLNLYLFNARLQDEDEVPYAMCPTDPGEDLYNLVGSSYSTASHTQHDDLTNFGDNIGSARMTEIINPSKLVIAGEHSAQGAAWGEHIPQQPWHEEGRFNVLFADSHAATIQIPKVSFLGNKQLDGGDWIYDEYRTSGHNPPSTP